MLYDDPKQEADSIMGWLDRRLPHADVHSFIEYTNIFKREWKASFGTLDSVPQEFADKVKARFNELKGPQ
jgi:hypothetical protein